MMIWWWFDDDLRMIWWWFENDLIWFGRFNSEKNFYSHFHTHTQIHISIIWILFIYIFTLLTMKDVQFYAVVQVKSFQALGLRERRNLRQKSKYMEFIFSHSHKSWPGEWRKYINPRIGKYFFLLGEIFTTHFLRQTLSEQMGRGVPSDLVGIWKIILWFPALESNCILMAG